ncbi:MAG: ferredoxin [Bacteroides sp.]|nr:ferredoxin [Bacteroides sp.]
MIQNERELRHEQVLRIAMQMMTAARTAPKGKGIDIIEVALVTGEDLKVLSDRMVALAEEQGMKFFLRDADNILSAECVVLIGTREQPQGLNCGHCGYAVCGHRPEGVPCALNTIDVGIAIGSACATAADHRVDTRVMFSAGLAAQRMNWLEDCRQVFAIPVSASSKNPFFDRKPKEQVKA